MRDSEPMMLPPPPSAPSAETFGSATDSAHPRAPADWLADRLDAPAASAPVADSTAHRKDPSAEEDVLVAPPLRVGSTLAAKKPLLMIGGGVAAVAIVLVIVLSRGGSSKQAAHGGHASAGSSAAAAETGGGSSATGDDEHDESSSMKLPSHRGTGTTAAAMAGSAEGSADTIAGSNEAGSTGSAAVATVEPPKEPISDSDAAQLGTTAGTPAKHHTLGGKQVVLEYDTPTHEAPKAAAAPKEDSAAVEKARAAYATGNQKLFAGDAAGAVRAYQQSLAYYPGYVAGYRGLGLAYAQQGDKPKALQAFRTYLSSVPGAKDATLIRKRVTALAH